MQPLHHHTHLVEVEDQIQLANIAKELIQHLDKEMDCFQVRQLIVIGIDANAKEQPRISPVNNLGAAAELDEIRLVFLISRSDEAMDLDGH